MAITGPVALFNNPPIEPQYFQPWRFAISAITLGVTTTVTVIVPLITILNYVIGQEVRLLIPPTFGCRQLNNQTGFVIGITPPNQIIVDINSTTADPYIASTAPTPAQIIAIGDINTGPINQGRSNNSTVIAGSFINISPN
jgi:hypothetical protein